MLILEKEKSFQTKDLSLHLKKLEKSVPVIPAFRKLSLEDH
jgi:hypothetical protein